MFLVLPCVISLIFFSPFSIAITSLGEERANLSAFRTFVRCALVSFCLFPLPLRVWVGLQLAACDSGTSRTFLLPFLNPIKSLKVARNIKGTQKSENGVLVSPYSSIVVHWDACVPSTDLSGTRTQIGLSAS